MCCRYYFDGESRDERVRRIVSLMERDYAGEYKTGEIFPGDAVPAILGEGGQLRHAPAVFGFPGFDGKKLILNARAETAAVKPTFAEAFRQRRAILPADGFYEWSRDGKKTKYLFTRGASAIYLCGLYALFDGRYRFVILTKPANDSMREVHDRMPVIAAASEVRPYLTDADFARRLVCAEGPALRREAVEPDGAKK